MSLGDLMLAATGDGCADELVEVLREANASSPGQYAAGPEVGVLHVSDSAAVVRYRYEVTVGSGGDITVIRWTDERRAFAVWGATLEEVGRFLDEGDIL